MPTVPEKSRRCTSFSVRRSRTSAMVATVASEHVLIPKSPDRCQTNSHLCLTTHHILPWPFHVPTSLSLLAGSILQSTCHLCWQKAVGMCLPSGLHLS